MSQSDVRLRGIQKSYGKVHVIHGVDLDIEPGEFAVFVGPSGCGKSTLLRMIAGLEEVSGGTLTIGGEPVNDLPPSERGVAMVFQSYALYPHKTVFDNMAFALKIAKVPKEEIEKRVNAAADRKVELLDMPRERALGEEVTDAKRVAAVRRFKA